jgi:hypothetical protein
MNTYLRWVFKDGSNYSREYRKCTIYIYIYTHTHTHTHTHSSWTRKSAVLARELRC